MRIILLIKAQLEVCQRAQDQDPDTEKLKKVLKAYHEMCVMW